MAMGEGIMLAGCLSEDKWFLTTWFITNVY